MSSRPCCSNGGRERSPPSFARTPKMVVSFKNRGAVVSFKNRGAHLTCPRARHRCAILRYSPVPSWSDIPTAVSLYGISAELRLRHARIGGKPAHRRAQRNGPQGGG